jgi:hypothetical protein
MKAVKRFFIIGGVLLLLLSVVNVVINTEVEYDNEALCIYIDYAIGTLVISGGAFIIAVIFLILSLDINTEDDFNHIVRKY